MKKLLWAAAAATLAGAPVTTIDAQLVRIAPRAMVYAQENPNAARIGVYLGENDLRDTLGVLVSSLVEDGPAAQAGIREGDRIAAVDGVNLRMTRLDAEDSMLRGMMGRRLTRTLDAKSAGDEVELQVWSNGSTRTVRAKTVAARDLETSRERSLAPLVARITGANRAALGMSLGSSPSRRDTLGVLIIGLTQDGPAERAGLIEGDRIARINDTDLRVPREDAGDATLSNARVHRLSREVNQLEPGSEVTLTVWSGGRQREVRLTAVPASELRSNNMRMFIGDGVFPLLPQMNLEIPRIDVRTPAIDVRARIRASLEAVRRARS